jgi:ABC-2 type transport system permease protein
MSGLESNRLLLSAWLSYRALFSWLNPAGYVSSRLISPAAVVVLFGLAARHGGGAAVRPALGASLLAVATASLFGVTLSIVNERHFGTLGSWLFAPQGLLLGLAAKALPHCLDALVSGGVTLGVAVAVFGLHLDGPTPLAMLLAGIAAAVSGAGLGALSASVSLAIRDDFTAPNFLRSILMVFSGTLVAAGALPIPDASGVSTFLPLHHAWRAVDTASHGGGIGLTELGAECLVGAVYGGLGYVSLRLIIRRIHRTGSWALD